MIGGNNTFGESSIEIANGSLVELSALESPIKKNTYVSIVGDFTNSINYSYTTTTHCDVAPLSENRMVSVSTSNDARILYCNLNTFDSSGITKVTTLQLAQLYNSYPTFGEVLIYKIGENKYAIFTYLVNNYGGNLHCYIVTVNGNTLTKVASDTNITEISSTFSASVDATTICQINDNTFCIATRITSSTSVYKAIQINSNNSITKGASTTTTYLPRTQVLKNSACVYGCYTSYNSSTYTYTNYITQVDIDVSTLALTLTNFSSTSLSGHLVLTNNYYGNQGIFCTYGATGSTEYYGIGTATLINGNLSFSNSARLSYTTSQSLMGWTAKSLRLSSDSMLIALSQGTSGNSCYVTSAIYPNTINTFVSLGGIGTWLHYIRRLTSNVFFFSSAQSSYYGAIMSMDIGIETATSNVDGLLANNISETGQSGKVWIPGGNA